MATWEAQLAFRHAPVLLQKVHDRHMRADFVTRIDFARPWNLLHENWDAVWEKDARGRSRHELAAHAYYSVVATHTHWFLVYAFYHPQDWTAFWGPPAKSSPWQTDQHVHDMQGCLAIVPRNGDDPDPRCEALLTVSHHHFYSYAGWQFGRDDGQPSAERTRAVPYRVTGWLEDRDGAILGTSRFAGERSRRRDEPAEPPRRFKLYSQAQSHAIRGDQNDWGDGKRIVRYRPSLVAAEEPSEAGFAREDDAQFQTVRYRLVSMFAPDGPWPRRHDPRVFQTNDRGQEAFVEVSKDGELVPGRANPPWGWDDTDDRNKVGEFAWDPAHLADAYFTGLRAFSRAYLHNPYVGIVMA